MLSIRCIPERRGVAMVEAALLLPLLLLIVLGAVDFGRFAYSHIAITNAARTGAAFGAVNPFTTATRTVWETNVRQRITDDLGPTLSAAPGFAPATDVTAVRSIETLTGLWSVRVEVSYPFRTIVPWPGIPGETTLRRAVEMRGIR